MAALNMNPNARERAPGLPPQFASTLVPTALGLLQSDSSRRPVVMHNPLLEETAIDEYIP
jgi:hypothetical protein